MEARGGPEHHLRAEVVEGLVAQPTVEDAQRRALHAGRELLEAPVVEDVGVHVPEARVRHDDVRGLDVFPCVFILHDEIRSQRRQNAQIHQSPVPINPPRYVNH